MLIGLIPIQKNHGQNHVFRSLIRYKLDLTNNPDLRYIQVDDVAYSNANWSGDKDATARFSENCH